LTVNARLTLFVEILSNLRHFAVEINSPNTAARDDCFLSADKASVTELASTLAKQRKVKAFRIRDGLSAVSILTV
jgi:hypothetical protein